MALPYVVSKSVFWCFTFKGQLANSIEIVKAHALQIKKLTSRNVVFRNTCIIICKGNFIATLFHMGDKTLVSKLNVYYWYKRPINYGLSLQLLKIMRMIFTDVSLYCRNTSSGKQCYKIIHILWSPLSLKKIICECVCAGLYVCVSVIVCA